MGVRVSRFMFESFRELEEAKAQERQAAEALAAATQSAEPTPPPPAITEEELSAAREQGRQEGYDDGFVKGQEAAQSHQAEVDRHIEAMLPIAIENILSIENQYRSFLKEQKHSMSQLILAIAKKVAGHAIHENPLAEIEAMVAECLVALVDEPVITVFAQPELVPPLKQRLESALKNTGNSSATLQIEADPQIAVGDCRITWKNGAAERNSEKLWENVTRIINQRYAHMEEEEAAHTDDESTGTIGAVADSNMNEEQPLDNNTASNQDIQAAQTGETTRISGQQQPDII